MNTKLTTFLFFILCSTAGFAQQYGWISLTSPNPKDILSRIYISGPETWLLSTGKLYYSSIYPITQFTEIFSSSFGGFSDITFVNQGTSKYGWIVGVNSMGARTKDDSALVWQDVYVGGETLGCVSFPNENTGYATDTGKSLFKTVDGGATWIEINNNFSVSSINGLFFTDSLTGYFVGSSPAFKKTTDGGLTWTNIGTSVTGSVCDIYFYDNSHGWAVGVSDIFYLNGNSWMRIANTSGSTLYSVFFVNTTEGWAVGLNGTIIHSTDGGATWSTQTSGTTATLRDVFFTSPTNGYAVGNNGTILHYTQLTGTEEDYKSEKSVLGENYPNPFNETTTIDFLIEKPSHVLLEVFSIGGEKICTLANEKKFPGNYSVPFHANDLPAGIYYYRLQTETGTSARKMTLIK